MQPVGIFQLDVRGLLNEEGFATEREPGMLEVLLPRDGDGVVYSSGTAGGFHSDIHSRLIKVCETEDEPWQRKVSWEECKAVRSR